MPEDPRERHRIERRRVLQIMGSGFGSALTATPAIAGDYRQNQLTGGEDWMGNLLPTDQADALEPTVSKDISDSDEMLVDVHERYAEANEMGFLQIGTAGDLGHGQGELASDGAAWVESTWQPTNPGEHRVTVEYKHGATHSHRTLQTNADLILTSQANLAVVEDETDTVVAETSTLGQNELSAEMQEALIERLLSRIVLYILFPGLGFVGRLLGGFLLGPAIGQLIEIEANRPGPLVPTPLRLTFDANPASTYRIRFTANNGFSGRTLDEDDMFMADSSSYFELTDFSVEPKGSDF